MSEITTTATPYIVAGKTIVRLEITQLHFVAFCAAGDAAARYAKTDKMVQKNLFRERIKRQVKAYTADNSVVPLDDAAILNMPAAYAIALKAALNEDEPKTDDAGNVIAQASCEMLNKGDGMITPIHIKLGTPIKYSNGNEIAELEFLAGTLGDLEDVVAADNQLERTIALLSIAKPVGISLMSMPSQAVEQITLADGSWIMSEVVPAFLPQQRTS